MTTTPDALKLAAQLRAHDDDRLYREADELMADAAALIEQQHAALESLRSDLERASAALAESNRDANSYFTERNTLRAEVESLRAGRAEPDGWRLVPIKITQAMKDVGIQFEFATVSDGRLLAQSMWNELLTAAPTPTQAEQSDWTQPHPPTRHCMCPSCIPSFDDRFKPWVEQAGKVARFDGDNNIESPFNACMHKSYCLSLKNRPAPQPDDARDAFAGRAVPDDQGNDQVAAYVLREWLAEADIRNNTLTQHLHSVLEVARTWQPDYATAMDIKTLDLAAAEVGHTPPSAAPTPADPERAKRAPG